MKILLALWRLLDRHQRRRLVLLQAVSVLMAFSTVGGIAAVLPFFTVLAEPGAVSHSAVLSFLYDHLGFGDERRFLFALGIGFAGIVVLAGLVNLLGTLAMNRFAYQVGDAFFIALFDEYLHRSYRFHLSTHSATLLSRIVHDTARVTSGILQSALVLATNVVTILCIVCALVLLNPLVAACTTIALGASYTAIYWVARKRLLRNGVAQSRAFAKRNQVVAEGLGAIREVILLRAQPTFVEDFARRCKSISATIVSTFAISQSPKYVLESAMVCSLVAVALYLSGDTTAKSPWIAQLSFIGLAAYRLLPALQQAYAAIVRIRADRAAFDSIAPDLRLARESRRIADPGANDSSWAGRPRHEIRVESVSFRYASEGPAAISNLSLRIPAGAIVGFMGANGSGKTTLTDVVAGLVVPESGHVEVDGVVVDDTNRGAWQSTLAYVPQQIVLLDSSLAENIALGVPPGQIDRARLDTAVRLAQLEECVASLPDGYETRLGEGGGRLSGGQRQRLGIARALYRDASVLIMDEATSSLDSAAEQEIVDMVAALAPARTIILVAHRLSALQSCDIVFELENGQIVRSGSCADSTLNSLWRLGESRANRVQRLHPGWT